MILMKEEPKGYVFGVMKSLYWGINVNKNSYTWWRYMILVMKMGIIVRKWWKKRMRGNYPQISVHVINGMAFNCIKL